MRKNKLFTLLVVALFVFAVGFVVSCDEKVELSLDKISAEIGVTETVNISYSAVNANATATYTVKDASIVSVSDSGVVTGLKEGSTTVEVVLTADDKAATTSTYNFLVRVVENRTVKITYASANAGFEGRTQTVKYGTDVELSDLEYAANYTFKGWATTESSTSYITKLTNVTKDTTVYAQFEKNTYTIKYDLDGATYDGATSASYGDTVTLGTPAKDSYEFLGWTVGTGTEYVSSFEVKGNTNVYAHFAKESYKVTYELDGGSYTGVTTVEDGADVELYKAIKDGYYFLGWSLEKGGKTYITKLEAVKADTTVYANWQKAAIQVSYELNGGSLDNPITALDAGMNLTLNTPEKAGYTFLGWTTKASSTSYVTELTNVTSDVTLYAQWKAIEFTVTYELDGGSYTGATTVEWGKDLDLTDAAKEGYVFLGWTLIEKSYSYITKVEDIKEDITLYAHFSKDPVKITYVLKGATYEGVEAVEPGTEIALGTPVKTGYTFLGWTTEPGSTDYIYKLVVNEPVALYANFLIKNITITYVCEAGHTSNPTTIQYGSDLTLSDPILTYANFIGWSLSATSTNYITELKYVTEDLTLYAHYDLTHVYIVYDFATGSTKTARIEYNKDVYHLEYEPTRDGYTFLGWTLEGSDEYINYLYNVTDRKTRVVAHWAKTTYGTVAAVTVGENGQYATLTEALENVEPGATIRVLSGTYNEEVVVNVDNVNIIGPNANLAAGVRTYAEANFTNTFTITANGVIINGLGFSQGGKINIDKAKNTIIRSIYSAPLTSAKTDGSRTAHIYSLTGFSTLQIYDSYIDCGNKGGGARAGIFNSGTAFTGSFVVKNCIFTNSFSTSDGNYGEAIRLNNIGSGVVTITDNTFNFGTSQYILFLGVNANKAAFTFIRNNTFSAISNKKWTSGLAVRNLADDAYCYIEGNEFNRVSGNTLNFGNKNAANGGSATANVYVKYNIFDADTAYKISAVGNGTITYSHNYYGKAQTTATPDYGTMVDEIAVKQSYAEVADDEGAYYVSLDANGGVCDTSYVYKAGGAAVKLPTPTREGYEFVGWQIIGELYYVMEIDADNHCAFKAKAIWRSLADTHKVTYVLNGGSMYNYEPVYYTVGYEYELPTPYYTGYKFAGWYDNEYFYYDVIETIPTTANTDLVLYAKWEEDVDIWYNVTLDTDGGVVDPYEGVYFSYLYSFRNDYIAYSGIDFYDDETYAFEIYRKAVDETGMYTLYKFLTDRVYGKKYELVLNTINATRVANGKEELSALTSDEEVRAEVHNLFRGCAPGEKNGSQEYGCDYRTVNTVEFNYPGFTTYIANGKFEVRPDDDEYNLPDLYKEGYAFIGWYDEDGNKCYSVNFDDLSGDIKLTAKFGKVVWNDTAYDTLQDAVAAKEAAGSSSSEYNIYLGSGTYDIDSTINFSTYTNIYGPNRAYKVDNPARHPEAIINFTNKSGKTLFASSYYLSITGVTIKGNSDTARMYLATANKAKFYLIYSVIEGKFNSIVRDTFTDATNCNHYFESCKISDCCQFFAWMDKANYLYIKNCEFDAASCGEVTNTAAALIRVRGGYAEISNTTFTGDVQNIAALFEYKSATAKKFTVNNCTFENVTKYVYNNLAPTFGTNTYLDENGNILDVPAQCNGKAYSGKDDLFILSQGGTISTEIVLNGGTLAADAEVTDESTLALALQQMGEGEYTFDNCNYWTTNASAISFYPVANLGSETFTYAAKIGIAYNEQTGLWEVVQNIASGTPFSAANKTSPYYLVASTNYLDGFDGIAYIEVGEMLSFSPAIDTIVKGSPVDVTVGFYNPASEYMIDRANYWATNASAISFYPVDSLGSDTFAYAVKVGLKYNSELDYYEVVQKINAGTAFSAANKTSDFYLVASTNYADGYNYVNMLFVGDKLTFSVNPTTIVTGSAQNVAITYVTLAGDTKYVVKGIYDITLPEVTKFGCEFKGWYDNENFEGEPVKSISGIDKVAAGKTYYAKFEQLEYYAVAAASNNGNSMGANNTLEDNGLTIVCSDFAGSAANNYVVFQVYNNGTKMTMAPSKWTFTSSDSNVCVQYSNYSCTGVIRAAGTSVITLTNNADPTIVVSFTLTVKAAE